MLDCIFPDLKMVRCCRCDCQVFTCSGPSYEKVKFVQDGELIEDELEWHDYTCKECGLTWRE